MEKIFIILEILWIFLTTSAVSADDICFDDNQDIYVFCGDGCCGSRYLDTSGCCSDNGDDDGYADTARVWRILGWSIGAAIILVLTIMLICWCLSRHNRKNRIVIPTQPHEVMVPYYIQAPQYQPPPPYAMSAQGQSGPSTFPAAQYQPIPEDQLYSTKSQERPEGIQGVPPSAQEFRNGRSQPESLGLPGNHNIV